MRTRTIGLAAAVALTLAACTDTADDAETLDPQVPVATGTAEDETGDGATDDDDTAADDGATDDTATDDDAATDDMGAGAADAPDESTDLNGYKFEVSLEDALEILESETGTADPHHVGMDWDDDAWVWKIEAMSGNQDWVLEIDATTGEVRESEMDDEDDTESPLDFDSAIDHMEAMQIAVGEVSGSVTEWDLSWDDGRQEYEIEIDDETDVKIDADSGEIVEVDD